MNKCKKEGIFLWLYFYFVSFYSISQVYSNFPSLQLCPFFPLKYFRAEQNLGGGSQGHWVYRLSRFPAFWLKANFLFYQYLLPSSIDFWSSERLNLNCFLLYLHFFKLSFKKTFQIITDSHSVVRNITENIRSLLPSGPHGSILKTKVWNHS